MKRMVELSGRELPDEVIARLDAARRRPGRAARRGHRDRDRAVRGAARRRRAGPALLHAQPVQGDARDLRRPAHHRLSASARHYGRASCEHRHRHRPGSRPGRAGQRRRPRRRGRPRGAGVAEAYAAMAARRSHRRRGRRRAHTEERRIASTGINVWPWHDHRVARRASRRGTPRHRLRRPRRAGAMLGELAARGRRRPGDRRRRARGHRGPRRRRPGPRGGVRTTPASRRPPLGRLAGAVTDAQKCSASVSPSSRGRS